MVTNFFVNIHVAVSINKLKKKQRWKLLFDVGTSILRRRNLRVSWIDYKNKKRYVIQYWQIERIKQKSRGERKICGTLWNIDPQVSWTNLESLFHNWVQNDEWMALANEPLKNAHKYMYLPSSLKLVIYSIYKWHLNVRRANWWATSHGNRHVKMWKEWSIELNLFV